MSLQCCCNITRTIFLKRTLCQFLQCCADTGWFKVIDSRYQGLGLNPNFGTLTLIGGLPRGLQYSVVINGWRNRFRLILANWNLRNRLSAARAPLGAAHGNSATALKDRNKALNKGIREELNQDRGYWSETPGAFLRLERIRRRTRLRSKRGGWRRREGRKMGGRGYPFTRHRTKGEIWVTLGPLPYRAIFHPLAIFPEIQLQLMCLSNFFTNVI